MILLAATILTTPVYEVQGEGFFRLEREGKIVYARSGSFESKDGHLVHESGLRISPPVRVSSSDNLRISPDGFVFAGGKTMSHIVLAKFDTPPQSDANGIFTSISRPRLGNPGDEGFGVIGAQVQNRPSNEAAPVIAIPESEAALPAGYASVVRVRDLTEIASPIILIGDVADVTGADAGRIRAVEIGPAPRPAEQRIITTVTIQSALRAARLDVSKVHITAGARATVRRATRTVEVQEVESAAREWLAEHSEYNGPLTLATQFSARTVPTGETTIRVSGSRDVASALIVSIELSVDAERQFTAQLVFNKQAGSGSSGGNAAVRTGQTVTVLLVSNAVVVEATGRVRTAGAVGDVVTVEITETKATLSGILRADGSVEVKL